MAEYYQRYVDQALSYDNYRAYLAAQQLNPINERMMALYFNEDLYLDTQPIIPPIQTINMTNKDGTILYNQTELNEINNIFNFFGAREYSIGRAWYDFCISYRTRYDEGLINTITDIKTEYSIP